MKLLSTLRMHVLRFLHGGVFQVWHVDNKGRRKVFWCDTLQDALEWVACSHRDDAGIMRMNLLWNHAHGLHRHHAVALHRDCMNTFVGFFRGFCWGSLGV